jgi:mono/diheme cytochrome c family protein
VSCELIREWAPKRRYYTCSPFRDAKCTNAQLFAFLSGNSLCLVALKMTDLDEVLQSRERPLSLWQRASHRGIPPRPLDVKGNSDSGGTRYDSECGICHGSDGRGQTPIGQWMYPRAADLTSERVQSFSDEELFWIIQNGIRFTGMPAFGKVETGDNIWTLVDHVRTLRRAFETRVN